MATVKQRKAVSKTVENGGNITKAMRDTGYKEATINNPKNLTASKGFAEVLDEYGLTDNFLTQALVDDITKKPGQRKPELELGFKVRGRLKDSVDVTSNGEKIGSKELSDEELDARIKAYLKRNPSS